MKYLIVHGFKDCDVDAAELIYVRLRQKGLSAEVITDEELLKRNSNGDFIISVGGPKVNRITGKIQEIYQRSLDVAGYDMPNFVWAYGSRGGVKSNNHHLTNPCIALFGPEAQHTFNSAKDFISYGGLLDDICVNCRSWK